MQASTGSGSFSSINVTPMIDVILVLLIIFMVITPIIQTGYLARLPEPAPPQEIVTAGPQIMLRYDADGTIWLNRVAIQPDELGERLRSAIGDDTGRMVFFAGDPEAGYQETMAFLDTVRAAGADNIGLIVDP